MTDILDFQPGNKFVLEESFYHPLMHVDNVNYEKKKEIFGDGLPKGLVLSVVSIKMCRSHNIASFIIVRARPIVEHWYDYAGVGPEYYTPTYYNRRLKNSEVIQKGNIKVKMKGLAFASFFENAKYENFTPDYNSLTK